MSQYTTNTSDKKKATALKWWAIGLLGVFGFEYFYVGKIKKGIIRSIIGVFVVLAIFSMSGSGAAIPVSIIFWAVSAVPNLFKILFGTFRDNVNAALRE